MASFSRKYFRERMQPYLGDHITFLGKRNTFEKECNISWEHAILLQENANGLLENSLLGESTKFLRRTTLLWKNATFLLKSITFGKIVETECKYFVREQFLRRTQYICERKQMFCRRSSFEKIFSWENAEFLRRT